MSCRPSAFRMSCHVINMSPALVRIWSFEFGPNSVKHWIVKAGKYQLQLIPSPCLPRVKCLEELFSKSSQIKQFLAMCEHWWNKAMDSQMSKYRGSFPAFMEFKWIFFSVQLINYNKFQIPIKLVCSVWLQNPIVNLIAQPIKILFFYVLSHVIPWVVLRLIVSTIVSNGLNWSQGIYADFETTLFWSNLQVSIKCKSR